VILADLPVDMFRYRVRKSKPPPLMRQTDQEEFGTEPIIRAGLPAAIE